MEINVESLINEICSRPTLWNRKNKSYHNRIIVEKQWQKVADVMKIPKDQLKKKWKTIRDQFRNESKKIPFAISGVSGISEAQYDSYVTWSHFKSLLFLKDQIKRRKPIENLSSTSAETHFSDEENSEQGNVEDPLISDPENYEEFDEFEVASDAPKKKKFKVTPCATDKMLAMEKRKLELVEKKYNPYELDDDEAFFHSLLPFVKKLDMNEKLRCRMDIQNTVYNYVFPSGKT